MQVIFFPRNEYPNNVEVCTHRLGKKITFCEATTMIPYYVEQKLLPYIVGLHESHNIKVCAYFDNIRNGNPTASVSSYLGEATMQAIADGTVFPGLYFLSNPTDDYSEEAIMRQKEILWPWYENKFGRKLSAMLYGLMPYRYGEYLKPYILGTDSNTVGNNTDYGLGVGNPDNVPYSKDVWYVRNFNIRALDMSLTNENYSENIAAASSFIDSVMALPKGGMIYSFNHWHNLLYKDIDRYTGEPIEGRNDYAIEHGFKPYFNMLAEKNANDEIIFSGFGEAVEYLVYRDSIVNVAMYSPKGSERNKLVVRLETRNVFNVDMDLLQTPVSVKFSTTGTPLQNKVVGSDCNLIDLGSNNYIVEIPYGQFPKAEIYELNS